MYNKWDFQDIISVHMLYYMHILLEDWFSVSTQEEMKIPKYAYADYLLYIRNTAFSTMSISIFPSKKNTQKYFILSLTLFKYN